MLQGLRNKGARKRTLFKLLVKEKLLTVLVNAELRPLRRENEERKFSDTGSTLNEAIKV